MKLIQIGINRLHGKKKKMPIAVLLQENLD